MFLSNQLTPRLTQKLSDSFDSFSDQLSNSLRDFKLQVGSSVDVQMIARGKQKMVTQKATVVHFNAEPELMDPSGKIFTVGIVFSTDENCVVHEVPVENVVRVTANWGRFNFQRKLDVLSTSVNDVSAQLNTHPYSAYTALYRQNTVLHSSSREISSLEPPSHSMEISKEYFEGRQRVGSWPNRYR